MKLLFCCLFLALGIGPSFAQDRPSPEMQARKMKEIRESLRFVRMAESRKRLGFSDEKLLDVNELLDRMEAQKIDLISREHQLRRKLQRKDFSEDEAEALFDELLTVKKDIMNNETQLWSGIRDILNPQESIEFFLFYDRFTKEVQRRMRDKRGRGQGPRGRRQ